MAKLDTAMKASKGIWPLIRRIFSINFFALVLFAILVFSIIMSVQQGSIEPMVTGIGGKAFISLNSLNADSLLILDESYKQLPFWTKFWRILNVLGSFIFIFIWLKVLAWVVGRSIFGGDISRVLTNWSVAILIFLFLQVIFVLYAGSTGALGEAYNMTDGLKLPFTAMSNFVKALPAVLEPIINIGEKFDRDSNISTSIINSSNST